MRYHNIPFIFPYFHTFKSGERGFLGGSSQSSKFDLIMRVGGTRQEVTELNLKQWALH